MNWVFHKIELRRSQIMMGNRVSKGYYSNETYDGLVKRVHYHLLGWRISVAYINWQEKKVLVIYDR